MGPLRKLMHAAWAWNNRPRAMTPVDFVNLLQRIQADDTTPGRMGLFSSASGRGPTSRIDPWDGRSALGPGFNPATDAVLAQAIDQPQQVALADAHSEANGS
jgi:hypothetical protein